MGWYKCIQSNQYDGIAAYLKGRYYDLPDTPPVAFFSAATAGYSEQQSVPSDNHLDGAHNIDGSFSVKQPVNLSGLKMDNVLWDDLRFPLTGQRLDVSGGRVDYNYFNASVDFQANARYPNEPTMMFVQMPHGWKEGSTIYPHLHWSQQSANMPNWMIGWRKLPKAGDSTRQTDYSGFTLTAMTTSAFTYTSGSIHQISRFDAIDMTGLGLSDCLQIVLFRDSLNTSGLFAGIDPSALIESMFEFDIHYQIDGFGSQQEFIKD